MPFHPEAKRIKRVSFTELAHRRGRHVVWTTAAIMGQAAMDANQAGQHAAAMSSVTFATNSSGLFELIVLS